MSSTTAELTSAERPAPPHGRVSFEQFMDWMDEDTRAEWVDGEIVLMSPASDSHQDLSDFLIIILRLFVKKHKLGWIRSGPFIMRTAARPSGREPDIMFVSTARLDIVRHTFLDGPADLTVEIISPESIGRDRGDKFSEYEASSVREYWLIDPLRQEATFYQLGTDGLYHLGAVDSNGVYRSLAIPGFWLRVSWLWSDTMPDETDALKELGVF